MAIVFDTIVVRFGETIVGSAFASVFLDPEKNLDSAGNLRSRFIEGEEVFLVVHLEPGLNISRVQLTSGDFLLGTVSLRSNQQRVFFTDIDFQTSLSHFPSSAISPIWYGRQGNIRLSGRKISSTITPVIGDLAYDYLVIPLTIITPTPGLVGDETFPIGVVIFVE